MNQFLEKYLKLSYALLGRGVTPSYEQLQARYTLYPEEYVLEEINGLIYFLFCYPLVTKHNQELLEEGILLVFDKDTVIADLAFMHGNLNDMMKNEDVFDYISNDSDWSYLQHYTLLSYMFEDLPYPYCYADKTLDFQGEVSLFTNAYVTKSYRKNSIFSHMLEISKEQILRYSNDECTYYSAFSLDPDIACYGPDTPKEPYVYSFKDEEDRMRNKEILEKKGYVCIKLQELDAPSDGTKLWFAVLKENEIIIETNVN